jgi:DNA primase
MKYSEDIIQVVREATDIVEIVSQYVTLKKRGKSFIGLCPFHTEKTPSFTVDPIRGFYYCFGCSAGGNVFNFIMQMERVSFGETIRSLAEKAGIPLPDTQENAQEIQEIENLYIANQYAAEYFCQCLNDSEAGRDVKAYLYKRGFNDNVITDFQIGYAPDKWDGLLKSANNSLIRPEILKRAGLVVSKKEGEGYYDRFRDRLMFPIINPSGRVIGFGGRTLKEEDNIPKYINSSETPIFQKSHVLYGLFQSKSLIRKQDQVVIVEGYTDVMRLYQSGFGYCVATSGTALTEGQANLLSRYTKNVLLVYDGDTAGSNAALRGTEILIGAGLNVEITLLPSSSDPDSFIRDKGKEAMEDLLQSSDTIVDFHLHKIYESGPLKTPRERAEATYSLLNIIRKVKDPVERNLMIKDVAEKLDVDEKLLIQNLRQMRKSNVKSGSGQKTVTSSAKVLAEQNLIKLLIEDNEKWGKEIFQYLNPDNFETMEAQVLIEGIYQAFLMKEKIDPNYLMNKYNEDPIVIRYLTRLLAENIEDDVNRSKLGLDCLLNLYCSKIQEQIFQVRKKIKSSQVDTHEISQYSKEWMELKKNYNKLRMEIILNWKKNVEI